MIDIRSALGVVQEILDESVNQIKTNVKENAKDGVDTKLVVEAITAVGTLVGGIAAEILAKLPKSDTTEPVAEQDGKPVTTELDKIIGRIGLVRETELAELRKRVVDLEASLAEAQKPAPNP